MLVIIRAVVSKVKTDKKVVKNTAANQKVKKSSSRQDSRSVSINLEKTQTEFQNLFLKGKKKPQTKYKDRRNNCKKVYVMLWGYETKEKRGWISKTFQTKGSKVQEVNSSCGTSVHVQKTHWQRDSPPEEP